MATLAAAAAIAYVLGRANEQIFMCCAPSPTFDQNVRHIRIQSHTISQHTPFSSRCCELDNATIPDGEHVQFWDVTQFCVLSFSFDVDVVAAAMQMPENCERFSNLYVRSYWDVALAHTQHTRTIYGRILVPKTHWKSVSNDDVRRSEKASDVNCKCG